jgi:anti-sigma factor (TIGR02949 family)
MNCATVQKYVHAYLDGELGTDVAVEVERHLGGCARCSEQVEFEASFVDQVRSRLSAEEAPARLVADVRSAIAREDARRGRWRATRMAVGFAAAAALVVVAWAGIWPLVGPRDVLPDLPPIEEQVVANVVKDPPLEVRHADAREVSEWFRGKVAFAVEPPRFADERPSELVGARLYNVGENDAAYLVYDVDGKKVTIQMFRDPEGAETKVPAGRDARSLPSKNGGWVTTTRGYTVGVFSRRGVTYTVTSADMDERAMAGLIEKMR